MSQAVKTRRAQTQRTPPSNLLQNVPKSIDALIQEMRRSAQSMSSQMAGMIIDGTIAPQDVAQQLDNVRIYIDEVKSFRTRWDGISSQFVQKLCQAPLSQMSETTVYPSDTLDKTVLAKYTTAVTRALHLLGGEAIAPEIDTAIEGFKLIPFTAADKQKYDNQKLAWHLMVGRALSTLKQEGRLVKEKRSNKWRFANNQVRDEAAALQISAKSGSRGQTAARS